MIIDFMLFKPSGKYYEGGEVEIPDDSNIYDDDIVEVIMDAQNEVIWFFAHNYKYDGWILVTKEKEHSNKFFTAMFKMKAK